MQPILDRDQLRALDAWAVQHGQVPSLLLMENAGRGAAEALAARVARGNRILVLCGPGNNAGDGLVVARRLSTLGRDARVVLLSDPSGYTGDAKVNLDAWRGLGGELQVVSDDLRDLQVHESDVVVDAMFGTGLSRPLSGHYARAIELLNQSQRPCFALDLPSGLDAETGRVLGHCVRACATFTFAHLKSGLFTSNGLHYAGQVELIDIGVPSDCHRYVGQRAGLMEATDVAGWVRRRPRPRHKGAAGRVVVFAGSAGFVGAAKLVALGCLRAGAGLLTIATFEPAASRLEQDVWEAMVRSLSDTQWPAEVDGLLRHADVAVIGPGWSLNERARDVTEHVVASFERPVVLDADAVSHFAGRARDLSAARGPRILTPHPGEAARLLGGGAADVESDRLAALARLVDETQQTVLLKGERTCIGAPGALPCINSQQSAALATPGSGDVLSGVVAAFACHLAPFEAAASAAYLHGLSGKQWERATGVNRGALARDIAEGIPRALASVERSDDGLSSQA